MSTKKTFGFVATDDLAIKGTKRPAAGFVATDDLAIKSTKGPASYADTDHLWV